MCPGIKIGYGLERMITFHWFVDLNPPSGGAYGQIICVGLEEIRVVAKNYIEFLEIIIKSFEENESM